MLGNMFGCLIHLKKGNISKLFKSFADQILYNRLLYSPVRGKKRHKGLGKIACFTCPCTDTHTQSHICFPSSINSRVGRKRVRTGGEVWLRRREGTAALIIWAVLL
ncbi:hypothetical protein AMECASPLE_025692 [Ameca splendens]|uniref:Uncharacterized protein n=1 Tax=Ameca splendens TaxID=208324 RepID=A0ABV0ZEJ0_9TELE